MALYRHTIDRNGFEVEVRVPVGSHERRKLLLVEWVDRLEGDKGHLRHLYHPEPLFVASLIRSSEVEHEIGYILDHLGRDAAMKFESRPRELAEVMLGEAERQMATLQEGLSIESVVLGEHEIRFCKAERPGVHDPDSGRPEGKGVAVIEKPRLLDAPTAFEVVRVGLRVGESTSTHEMTMEYLSSLQQGSSDKPNEQV